MAWVGWFEYGGTEIINASRTEAYAKAANMGWFKPVYSNDALGLVLDEEYNSPLQDDAPWTDPDNLDTYDFYGAYPLGVVGIEDSTSQASVTESTLDGGVVGKVRRATRSVVFNLALVGATECAVEAGFRWLKAAVSEGPCASGVHRCSGQDLCYLACPPCDDWAVCDDPTNCLAKYQRSLRDCGMVTGPNVNNKATMTNGGVVWIVSMTLVAGNPFEFSAEVPLVEGFLSADIPYVVLGPNGEVPYFDDDGHSQTEVTCPADTFQPIFDPTCATALILPPNAPAVVASCFDFPVSYTRRLFTIPEQYVPLWGDVVPFIEIHTKAKEVRNLRLRFYADVTGDGSTADDPCAFCGDVLFSYIPAKSTMVFDGADHQVYVETGGGLKRRADSLVFGSDGNPFDWPELTCGYSYIVTVDTESADAPNCSIDLSLYARTV